MDRCVRLIRTTLWESSCGVESVCELSRPSEFCGGLSSVWGGLLVVGLFVNWDIAVLAGMVWLVVVVGGKVCRLLAIQERG